jgi:hypothetical protein
MTPCGQRGKGRGHPRGDFHLGQCLGMDFVEPPSRAKLNADHIAAHRGMVWQRPARAREGSAHSSSQSSCA